MSTKDFSSVDANSKTLAISNPNQDDSRYRNLNLNSIHQHSETNHALSKNVSFNKGNTFTNFTDHLTSQSKTKNDVNLWHKRDESFKTSEFLTFHDCDEKTNQKRWQKSDGSSANSSTLSLHIAAYESAIDTAETESSKKVQKHFYGSFEIPRQQEDSPVEPEVMQYKSSQKVLNPNETSSAKSLNKKSGKPSDKDKKHHEPQPKKDGNVDWGDASKGYSSSSYFPLTTAALAIVGGTILETKSSATGTILCPHDDSFWDFMGRRIVAGMIIAGVYAGAIYYSQQAKLFPRANRNVKFHVIDLHKNENAIREKPSSTDDNSDKTLRSVESLMSVQSSDASTQNSDDPPPPFPDGPLGSVSEESPKNGKITKSIQCGGNCTV